MAGTNYAFFSGDISVENGVTSCVEIAVPWRGIIRTFHFKQVDASGGLTADVNLYSSENACPPAGSSDSEQPYIRDAELWKVRPTASISADTLFEEYEKFYPYTNTDGNPSDPQRKLYLEITPSGTPDNFSTWQLAMDITTSTIDS